MASSAIYRCGDPGAATPINYGSRTSERRPSRSVSVAFITFNTPATTPRAYAVNGAFRIVGVRNANNAETAKRVTTEETVVPLSMREANKHGVSLSGQSMPWKKKNGSRYVLKPGFGIQSLPSARQCTEVCKSRRVYVGIAYPVLIGDTNKTRTVTLPGEVTHCMNACAFIAATAVAVSARVCRAVSVCVWMQ